MALSISSTVVSIVPNVVTIVMAIGVVSPKSSIVPVAIEVATVAFVKVATMLCELPFPLPSKKWCFLWKGDTLQTYL
jgi:hypothetical protein